MRNSREATAASRERIVAVAAKLFRERGIAAVGVAELMEAAGMTHGGFYKHFESKDALIAEACGLPDPAYFSRFFAQRTGLSPLAYRTRQQRNGSRDN